jgi:hypothetical protein
MSEKECSEMMLGAMQREWRCALIGGSTMNDDKVSFRVDRDLYEMIAEEARGQGCTVSEIVRRAIYWKMNEEGCTFTAGVMGSPGGYRIACTDACRQMNLHRGDRVLISLKPL